MRYMTVANKETLDSREVAKMVEKDHAHLCRDIKGYIDVISENPKLDSQDYFIPNTYKVEGNNKTYPCYDITKLGCEMIANKLTGKKGIMFTAEYVKRFNEMEEPMTTMEMVAAQAMAMVEQERKTKQLEIEMAQVKETQRIQNSRIDTFNGVCVEGTKRQKLVAMVNAYSAKNGLTYHNGWHKFKSAYNIAYGTSIGNSIAYYTKENGLKKKPTVPEFLEIKGLLDDGLRIADKLLNTGASHED